MAWIKIKPHQTTDVDSPDAYRRRYIWDQPRPDRDLVGPHNNRELNLMIAGKKPLALLDSSHFREGWQDEVQSRGWKWTYMIPLRGRLEDTVLVAPPEHEYRFKIIERVYANCRAKNDMTATDHAKIGILLGYTKEQIRAFLEKISYRLAA